MASENDAGRDKKLTLTLVASAVVALVGGLIFSGAGWRRLRRRHPRLISIASGRRYTIKGLRHRRIESYCASITRKA